MVQLSQNEPSPALRKKNTFALGVDRYFEKPRRAGLLHVQLAQAAQRLALARGGLWDGEVCYDLSCHNGVRG